MSGGVIRQMRYITGNVNIAPNSYYDTGELGGDYRIYDANPISINTNVTLLMAALDQNKVLVVSFGGQPISNGPFNGSNGGSAYLSKVNKITDGVELTFYSNAKMQATKYSGPNGYGYYYRGETKTFTYQLYIIEFY